MAKSPDQFDLSELADRAQVTTRTVRYYISQGLLPSAEGRGPSARYDETHLGRLLLIRQLQRQHLPLAEIRRQLEELSVADVRKLLESGSERARPSSALEYIRNLSAESLQPSLSMSMVKETRSQSIPEFSPILPQGPSSPAPAVPLVEWKAPDRPSSRESPDRSSWDRIHLSSDIELHVRRPLTRDQNRQLDMLLAYAHQLFSEDT